MPEAAAVRLRIGGMTCAQCQTRIEKALRGADGVRSASVHYADGCAEVVYDGGVITAGGIAAIVKEAGYEVLTERAANDHVRRAIGLAVMIAALYLLVSRLNIANAFPLAEAGAGYGALFVIGLLTSVHCVAMCGGINLSQCIPQSGGGTLRASALYNLGRVAAYTAVGAAVGGLGMLITPSGAFKGTVQILAGVFMVVMGANMLGLFPSLRKLTPRVPSFIARGLNAKKGKSNSPLVVGLLNGLMPCGPLQAMQLYALSTGSPSEGAAAMLLFSLGTVPLMFGLGALSSLLTKKFARKMTAAGAVLVAVLGLTMFTQGAALSGFALGGLPGGSARAVDGAAEPLAEENAVADGVQVVRSTLQPGSYPMITVQRGIPVKWVIDAPKGSVNGCNNSLYIPEYDLTHKLQTGENIIEFTPEKAGAFGYSCWMGMIRGRVTVVEGGPEPQANADTAAALKGRCN